jgi:hypothetical protein
MLEYRPTTRSLMPEETPQPSERRGTPIPVPTKGPHVASTLQGPPRPDAEEAFRAMVRKDLREHRHPDTA